MNILIAKLILLSCVVIIKTVRQSRYDSHGLPLKDNRDHAIDPANLLATDLVHDVELLLKERQDFVRHDFFKNYTVFSQFTTIRSNQKYNRGKAKPSMRQKYPYQPKNQISFHEACKIQLDRCLAECEHGYLPYDQHLKKECKFRCRRDYTGGLCGDNR